MGTTVSDRYQDRERPEKLDRPAGEMDRQLRCLRRFVRELYVNVRSVGVFKTSGDALLRILNHVLVFKVLKVIVVEAPNAAFLECDARYQGAFLTPAMLEEFAADPAYELSTHFLEHVESKGDQCYALLEGNTLAAYGWYSHQPTEISASGWWIGFAPQYVYMYKGFTHEKYRGQRLHAIGMTRALQGYREQGYRGVVAYVEWNNFGSLRSCYRMGYRDVGNLYVVQIGHRYLSLADAGCRQSGFYLQRTGEAETREFSGSRTGRTPK